MSDTLHLSVAEGIHIHVHTGPHGQVYVLPPAAVGNARPLATVPKKRPLQLAIVAMLVFGCGYGAHSIVASDANAQNGPTAVTATRFAPLAGYGEATRSAVPVMPPVFPSSVQVNPLPLPYANGPGQPSAYRGAIAQAPFPAAPDPGQPQAGPAAPAGPLKPFGLQ